MTHLWFLMTVVSGGEDSCHFRKPLGINGMVSLCPAAEMVEVRIGLLASQKKQTVTDLDLDLDLADSGILGVQVHES